MMDSATSSASCDAAWERVFRTQDWGRYPPEYVIRFIARNFYRRDRASVRVLDLGCGPGACTWFMAREGFGVAGIDGSPAAIQQAGARLAAEGLAAELRVGEYFTLPWPDATFDGVLDNASLYCNRFADCQRAVAEVVRVLKPGGRFLSCNFTDRTWGCGCGEEVEPGGYRDVTEGPLVGKGFSLFMDRPKIDTLYAPFADVKVEKVCWSADEMRHWIELWVVEAVR